MRSTDEVIRLIQDIAGGDDRIRAVLLNGSRANPLARQDKFQDFDIVYVVNDINTFLNDNNWIDVFGDRLILQMPDQMGWGGEINTPASFSYLILFKDCNRIDLTLFPLEKMESEFQPDSLTILLLDKDKIFTDLPVSTDVDYHIKRPTQKMFSDCSNEFWWVCTYVAKGLWRQEITYAKEMLEIPVRKAFLQVIEWHIGFETGFSVSFGKSGKNIRYLLPPALYEKILLTYPDANPGNIWNSLFIMADIFSELANKLSHNLSLEYNSNEDHNITAYLKWVYSLKNEQ